MNYRSRIIDHKNLTTQYPNLTKNFINIKKVDGIIYHANQMIVSFSKSNFQKSI